MDQRTDVVQADEIKIIVQLKLYETAVDSGYAQTTEECNAMNFEAVIKKNGSVAELKVILESQDLIPDDTNHDIEVRLADSSSPLPNTFAIPETTTHMLLSVRPKKEAASTSGSNEAEADWSDFGESYGGNSSLKLTTTALPESGQHNLSESAALNAFLNSSIMRNILSNTDFFQAFLNSHPRIREIRERNPQINYIMNDPEVLRESIEYMCNPSLMREVINNTDRVLRNIDVIPGGFNALRNVYESIQEPLWAATTGSNTYGSRSSTSINKTPAKIYDLQTDREPNTSVIPSPWATTTVPSIPTQTFTPSSHNSTLPVREEQQQPQQQPSLSNEKDKSILVASENVSAPPLPPPPPQDLAHPQKTEGVEPKALFDDTVPPALQSNMPLHDHLSDQHQLNIQNKLPLSNEPVQTQTDQKEQQNHFLSDHPNSSTHYNEVLPSQPTNTNKFSNQGSNLLPAAGRYPYLYQSVFPSQHRLRSLGGLGLPHAAHIRGVIRQQQQQKSSSPSSSSPDQQNLLSPQEQQKRSTTMSNFSDINNYLDEEYQKKKK